LGKTLPDFLSVEEINILLAAHRRSKAEGERKKPFLKHCIFFQDYVFSELVGLLVSNVF